MRALARPIDARARARAAASRALACSPRSGSRLAIAFAGAVLAESTIAGDRSARTVARGARSTSTAPSASPGRASSPRPVAAPRASRCSGSSDCGHQTEVVLMNPVRLSGVVVRPAAIAPLGAGSRRRRRRRAGRAGPDDCPMLLAGGSVRPTTLTAPGVRVAIAGSDAAALRGAARLHADQPDDGSRRCCQRRCRRARSAAGPRAACTGPTAGSPRCRLPASQLAAGGDSSDACAGPRRRCSPARASSA